MLGACEGNAVAINSTMTAPPTTAARASPGRRFTPSTAARMLLRSCHSWEGGIFAPDRRECAGEDRALEQGGRVLTPRNRPQGVCVLVPVDLALSWEVELAEPLEAGRLADLYLRD